MPNRVCVGVVASKAATTATMPTQRAIGSGRSKGFCSQNESLASVGHSSPLPIYLRVMTCVAVKNSLLRNPQKLDRIRMLYKRFSWLS
jgi:hypothetical protein